MAERRRFSISAGMLESPGVERVVEHDMDMKRARPQESAVTSRLGDLMRWLVPSCFQMSLSWAPNLARLFI